MNRRQSTSTVLMVRPVSVRSNEETVANNFYQKMPDMDTESTTVEGINEFDGLVTTLRQYGIRVILDDKLTDKSSPDAHFPNNWISFHQNGTVAVYPLFAENRRHERRDEVLERLESENFLIDSVIDYTEAESEELFLEGTGSMVLDRKNGIAYAALSDRTNEELFIEFCEDFEFFPVVFTAYQWNGSNRETIYHTNVMMSIAEHFAVVCLEAIDDKKERKQVLKHLKETGREVIVINEKQVTQFAGNVLELQSETGDSLLVMSESARKSFRTDQLAIIEKYARIISTPVPIIETCGGGSVRCMIAEVFLPVVK